eukprot:s6748_g3.t1
MQKTQSGQSYPNIGFDLQNDRGHEKNAFAKPVILTVAHIMVFQETHLAGHSFIAEGKRHGYRVWSVPAQQGQDALGRRTVNGGLTCVVKDGLPAYLVNSVSEDAGEALILQCGQWRVRGLWQRPSFVSAGGLTQHLLDAATAGYGVLALGDFNHLPTEGPLVAAGSAKAFAASE